MTMHGYLKTALAPSLKDPCDILCGVPRLRRLQPCRVAASTAADSAAVAPSKSGYPFLRTLLAAAAAVILIAPMTMAQAVTLRLRTDLGQRHTYERTLRSDTLLHDGAETRHTITETTVDHQELVIESKTTPPAFRTVSLDTPGGERLIAYEENGKDRLAAVPEAERLHPLPPVLSTQWLDPRGVAAETPTKATDINQAVEIVGNELRVLPAQAINPGDTWKRELDLGAAKIAIASKFTAQREVAGRPCVILDSSASLALAGAAPPNVKIEKMTSQAAWATDGSGLVAFTLNTVIVEKSGTAERRLERTVTEKLSEVGRVEPAQTDRARTDLAKLEKARDLAKGGKLDEAMAILAAFLHDNPQDAWVPAVRVLHDEMSKERFMTQTLPPERFRLVLRDLQATHDRLSGGGRTDQTAQVEAALRQLVTVNLKTLLADSAEPDPIIRDMAAFGLAFAGTEQATVRLTTMAKDASAQVRGTALIGLAILGKPVDAKIISTNLADADARVAGAAALVAGVTLKRDDPQAAALTPYIIDVLKSPNAWSRVNAMAALGKIAPAGNVSTVRALIAAGKAEKEPRLQPAYLQIMKMITGVDGKDVGAYEDWLRAQPDTAIGTKPLLPISPPHVELPGAPTPTRAPSPTPTVAPTPTAAPTSTVIPKG